MNLPYHCGVTDLRSGTVASQNDTILKIFPPKSSARGRGVSTLVVLAE